MRRTLLVLMLLTLCVPLVATAADSTVAPDTVTLAAPAAATQPEAPTAGQADDGAPPPSAGVGDADDDLPFLDLQAPKPEATCKAGWCSSDAQCEMWYGQGVTCDLAPGATCGHCAL